MTNHHDVLIRPEPSPSDASDLLQILNVWKRRRTLIVLVVLLSLGLGGMYYLRQPPIYEASAQLLITQKTAPNIPIKGLEGSGHTGSLGITLTTHTAAITSPLIVERAVRDKKLDKLPSYTAVSNVAGTIGRQLDVEPLQADSQILELSCKGSNPQDCATVVYAIVETYEDFLSETHRNIGGETVNLIQRAKNDLVSQLRDKEAAYTAFRQEVPLIWKDGQGTNLHRQRQAQIEKTRAEIQLRRSNIQSRTDAIQTALARGESREALMLMISQLSESSAGMDDESVQRQLYELLLEEQTLLDRFGPDHPQVESIRRRIVLARRLLGADGDRPVDAPTASGSEDFLATYVKSLREQVAALDRHAAELDALFAQEQVKAKSLSTYLVQDAAFRKDLERMQQLFEATVKRLEEINIVKDYGDTSMNVLSTSDAGYQVAPRLSRCLLLAGALGTVAGFGLGLLVDLADRSFFSPSEICRHLNTPLIGHIPPIPRRRKKKNTSGAAQLDPVLCTIHQPQSELAEVFRTVRTSLYFMTRGDRHQIIQITSPGTGDGKSTLAANLAVSIAKSGKRVLLIDADLRRPTLHRLFALSNKTGLVSVVGGKADLHDAVQQTPIEYLAVLPRGPQPGNPSELLTSGRFERLLDMLRTQYDFVLLDTPPLLAVTDASAVAARADGVLLTMRIRKQTRPDAQRATDILTKLHANLLGVVVNCAGGTRKYRYLNTDDRYGYGSPGQYQKYYLTSETCRDEDEVSVEPSYLQ